MKRRIETTTSRTAEMTCMSRAFSSLETNSYYKSSDRIAPLLLPDFIQALARIPFARRAFMGMFAPKGIYEYVIARTRYIDAAFEQALADYVDQVLIFGAGFDTRALRFQDRVQNTRIFELDAPVTQRAKIGQYHKRGLTIPANCTFISIDFDKEMLPAKLDEAGFHKGQKSLFILEGVLMYLQPESVRATFQNIGDYAGSGSQVVFDTIYASVLQNDSSYYGKKEIMHTVTKADEKWHFGIDRSELEPFLALHGFNLIDWQDAQALQKSYFTTPDGKVMGKINGTHYLVTAEKQ